jgi:hypothetical protein
MSFEIGDTVTVTNKVRGRPGKGRVAVRTVAEGNFGKFKSKPAFGVFSNH